MIQSEFSEVDYSLNAGLPVASEISVDTRITDIYDTATFRARILDALADPDTEIRCMFDRPNKLPQWTFEKEEVNLGEINDQHITYRFHFQAREGVWVPGIYAFPKGGSLRDTVVCMPGHGCSMDELFGIVRTLDARDRLKETRLDYARQALDRNYPVIVIEPESFGLRGDTRQKTEKGPARYAGSCHHAVVNAYAMGTTVTANRMLDCIGAIEVLPLLDHIHEPVFPRKTILVGHTNTNPT